MNRKCDISRRRDLTEKCLYALGLSLLVCMGFHHADATKTVAAVVLGPAGCSGGGAYAIGVVAAAASDEDLLPKTGGFSRTGGTSTTTTKTQSNALETSTAPPVR